MGANAVTTFPTYTTGQVLEAADLNITNCGVPVFAGTSQRDAAFGGAGEKVLAEGQLCYLESTNVVQYYDGSSWATVGPTVSKIGQVVSTTKNDTYSTTSTSFVDITGLSLSITPSSASSTILLVGNVNTSTSTTNDAFTRFMRDTTAINIGTGGTNNVTFNHYNTSNVQLLNWASSYLDSPATTSAITYKIQIRAGSDTVNVNRRHPDLNVVTTSSITAFEVLP